MKPGLLIHNPKAGTQGEALLDRLCALLPGVEPIAVDDLGDIAERAQGRPWVAVAGGDGTVGSIAAALIGKDVPLLIIPTGTYNNLARSLAIPLDPAEACELLQSGKPLPIDVGFANGKPFFECLGSGLDAALYPIGEEIKSGAIHRWFDLFHRAYQYPRQRFELTLDRPINKAVLRGSTNESLYLSRLLKRNKGHKITLSALMVMVSNAPFSGMNFQVAPTQTIDDGFFTVTVFSRYSKLQLWWHFFSVAFGRSEFKPKSIRLRVSKLEISGPRRLPVHLDGTVVKGLWPLEIACRKAAILVFRKP